MFEFDLYIPGDYPQNPPSVKFLTTGNCKVRFNPNLYNCGKVCLSIINTWSSPQWNAKSSTISQIILSISSMIFNEHPYTNEPAYYDCLKTEAGLKKSQDYNKKIKAYTLQYAINAQISNTSTQFKDIIKEIYNKNKDKIQELYQ
jgi:baculoviral IAP repeat-containing protein 6